MRIRLRVDEALQLHKTAHVAGKAFHAAPDFGPRRTDGPHDGAAHETGANWVEAAYSGLFSKVLARVL